MKSPRGLSGYLSQRFTLKLQLNSSWFISNESCSIHNSNWLGLEAKCLIDFFQRNSSNLSVKSNSNIRYNPLPQCWRLSPQMEDLFKRQSRCMCGCQLLAFEQIASDEPDEFSHWFLATHYEWQRCAKPLCLMLSMPVNAVSFRCHFCVDGPLCAICLFRKIFNLINKAKMVSLLHSSSALVSKFPLSLYLSHSPLCAMWLFP